MKALVAHQLGYTPQTCEIETVDIRETCEAEQEEAGLRRVLEENFPGIFSAEESDEIENLEDA